MIQPYDALVELVPSSCPTRVFHDLMGRAQAGLRDAKTLWLRTQLKPGLYLMELETRPGTFPSETMMLDLKQWPSLTTVPSGPFDFDHTQYKMQVPVFRVHAGARDCGLAWCEVPSPDDMRDRRIRAAWGVEIESADEQVITLEIPGDENRLRWCDVARLTIHNDHRYRLPVTPIRKATGLRRPRLFADAQLFQQLMTERDPVQQALIDNLCAQLDAGRDGTYVHRTATAALAGLLTGNQKWIDEAITRTMQICELPYWGYHDVKEIMGWNSDRDAGMRLFETAVVYDWLHDRLTDVQRETIRSRLTYFAAYVDKITHLQYGYWFTRAPEAHGQGLWFGFGCAALALLDDEPRAGRWLEWMHGNIHEALIHAPADGISEWFVFNVQWLILSALLLERAMGRRLSGSFPFLRGFSKNILRFVKPHGDKLPLLLFYLADRGRDGGAQADALVCARLFPEAKPLADAGLDPLTVLAYNPAIRPSRPTRRPKAAVSEGGVVACRDAAGDVGFTFRCGTPLTPRQHRQHTWNTQSWYAVSHSGSFSWTLRGQEAVPLQIGSYRKETHHANVVSIDGAGHRLDTRYLGGRIPLEQVSRIEQAVATPAFTYCHADSSAAYTDTCDIRRLFRRWVFFHGPALLIMHDLVEMTRPHLPAWHLHTTGAWRKTGAGSFVGEREGIRLAVRAFCPGASAALTHAVSPVEWVPPYGYGLNDYKTRDWQPEMYANRRQPPDYQELTLRPPGPVMHWELITVMGPDPDDVARTAMRERSGGTAVDGPSGSVLWSAGAPLEIGRLQQTVEADAAVQEGDGKRPGRLTLLGVRGWASQADPEGSAPVHLVWQPNAARPTLL